MNVILSCPKCRKKLQVADSALGKMIRCPGCAAVFTAKAASGGAVSAAPPARPAPPPSAEPVDEDEDDRPRKRPARSRREDDEEEDRPRKPARRRPREDDDEEDDRRPRRRDTRQKQGSGCAVAGMIVGAAGIVLLLVCAGVAYYHVSEAPDNFAAPMPEPGGAQAAAQRPPVPGDGGPVAPAPAPDPKPNDGAGPAPVPHPGGDPGPAPAPKPGGDIGAAAAAEVVGDLKVTPLTLGTGQGPACLCWATDARAFYHLDGQGNVRRVGYPTFREEASLPTGKKCAWLSVSALGVVLTVTDAQEMWLLDPKTLKVASRVPIAKAKRVVSAPVLSYAYAADVDIASATLNVIDLKAARVVKQYGHGDFGQPQGVNFEHGVLSDDGKRLYTTGGFGQVFRFALDGPAVTFGEASPALISGRFEGISLSPDGQYVCAPTGGGNAATEGEPQQPPYTTAVFAGDNFKKPLLRLKSGAYPMAVGFDTRAGLLYAQNHDSQLIVFDSQGIKLKEYNLNKGGGGSSTRQFLVHPGGRKLLVMGEGGDGARPAQLWYVELPAK
jgi:hypothetical protein